MASQKYANLAQSTLATGYTAGDSTISLAPGDGSKFPSSGDFTVGIGYPPEFFLKCTSRSSDTLTVTSSGTEGTTATNQLAGTIISQVISAAVLDGIRSDISQVGPYSSLPGSGMKSGDRYKCTDSPYDFFYDGSAWQAFFLGQLMTLPPAYGSWSWANQGSAAANSTYGYVSMQSPAIGVTDSHNTLYKTVPTAPYTVDFGLWVDACWTNYNYYGISLLDNSNKLVNMQHTFENGNVYYIRSWNSPTSYNGVYSSGSAPFFGNQLQWFRVVDDNTHRIFYRSMDGINWTMLGSNTVSRTDWITPTRIGWFASPTSSTIPMVVNLMSYREH